MRLAIIISVLILLLPAKIVKGYDYPIKPGSVEWKCLSFEERIKAIQIPDSIIRTIPTYDLIDLFLKNPITHFIFAYDRIQDGLNHVYREFNGLRELMNRNDLSIELIRYYKNLDPNIINKNWTDVECGKYSLQFIIIEYLFSRTEFIQQLSSQAKKQILISLQKKYRAKLNHYSIHSILGVQATLFSITHILYQTQYREVLQNIRGIRTLAIYSRITNKDIYTEINSYLNMAINKL